MENTQHIESVLSTIHAYWINRPHLRLGQIINNAMRVNGRDDFDTYYYPDQNIVEGISKLVEKEQTMK
jgi:hypothetical protein